MPLALLWVCLEESLLWLRCEALQAMSLPWQPASRTEPGDLLAGRSLVFSGLWLPVWASGLWLRHGQFSQGGPSLDSMQSNTPGAGTLPSPGGQGP